MSGEAKTAIGRTVRRLRESCGLSQEKLAERAGITYQYLSSLENGKENFSIGVLEALARSLDVSIPTLVERAYFPAELPRTVKANFVSGVTLPPGLSMAQLESVLNETHAIVRHLNMTLRRVSGRPLSDFIQKNNFSGIVSNILCDSFSRLTAFKHNHDQRYPDLVCKTGKGGGAVGLEVKCTIRPGKGGESHNGHSGWHAVACFHLDESTGDICFIHVMFADLVGHSEPDADWKYVGSKVNESTGSQRTEAYVTTAHGTAKLRHGTAYLDTDLIDISRWRTCTTGETPRHSPFRKQDAS